ncbi:porin family protein [Helicobacter trogontum]|uniref:porin family protein n=1 Tax=Helicobacter trogontum TaxID=50960 RepID=UPI001F35CFE3|nr:porin family protein [Helicobacter trogontum]
MSNFLNAKPVNIDEILSGKRQFRILSQLSYINIKSKNSLLTSLSHDVGSGNSIQIPISMIANSNTDFLNFAMSVRYGIYKNIEIFSTINAFYQHNTTNVNANFTEKHNGNFNTWNLGMLAQIKREGRYPALLLGGSIDLMNMTNFSNDTAKLQYFKGYSIFATSYYTIDPLVFLLQAGFRANLYSANGMLSVNSGEIFTLTPMVYFAVNPYVSLNFGITYQYKTKDFVDSKIVSMQGSSVGYNFGVAYEIKQNLILFSSIEYLQTSDYTSNAINLTLSYRI